MLKTNRRVQRERLLSFFSGGRRGMIGWGALAKFGAFCTLIQGGDRGRLVSIVSRYANDVRIGNHADNSTSSPSKSGPDASSALKAAAESSTMGKLVLKNPTAIGSHASSVVVWQRRCWERCCLEMFDQLSRSGNESF